MMPAIRNWTRDEMMKRVAFFGDLKGSKTGLLDSDLPECERELINVIGFPHEGGAAVSPVGSVAARLSAIPVSEGFNHRPNVRFSRQWRGHERPFTKRALANPRSLLRRSEMNVWESTGCGRSTLPPLPFCEIKRV